MDFSKVIPSSKLIIIIGIGMLVVLDLLGLVSYLLPTSVTSLYSLFLLVIGLLVCIPFFLLYLYAGFRAVYKYGMDPLSAGIVSAFSHFVIGIVGIILALLLSLVGFGKIALSSSPLYGSGSAGVGALFGLIYLGAEIIVLTCMIGVLICGLIINFIIGIIGGFFGKLYIDSKKPPEEQEKQL